MKIVELHLQSAQMDATAEFYGNQLGLPIIEKSEEQVVFRAGATSLHFTAVTTGNPFYHFAFNIVPSQYDTCLAWAKEHLEMIEVEENNYMADFPNWEAKAFYFFDNNRNVCECIARFDLQADYPLQQKLPAIISVSEIGIVVDDVPQYCAGAIREYELDYFSRQAPGEDFAALGDDEGLLIVASNNRNWFPTDLPSQKWPLKFVLEIGGATKKNAPLTTKTA